MANVNDPYSQNAVTPAQRARFNPQTQDSSWAAPWDDGAIPEVQNAHDQQAAPTRLYDAPLDNNIVKAPSSPPVVDRAAAETRARYTG